MTRVSRSGYCLLVVIACWGGVDCQLRRPKTIPSRMIEPQMLEPDLPDAARQVAKASNAAPVRLLEVEAREHIGRRVLHQQPGGELTEDSVWRWSSAPDRYLDTALRLEVASSSDVRLVDAGSAPALAATILVWDLESAGGARLVGAVEFQITGTDRVVHTKVVRDSEPVSAELPGDLAAVAGRLLRRVASQGLTFVTSEPYRMK
jgi:ABC-type transport auxiliary lipoprotein component